MPNHGKGGGQLKGVEDFHDEIIDQIHTHNWAQKNIIQWLADTHNIRIDRKTLSRYLSKWDAAQRKNTIDTEELRQRIHFMFCRLGAKDTEMLDDLITEGHTVTLTGLVRIRKELGLKRLEQSAEIREHMDEATRDLIMQELGKNVIQSYGRIMLVEHFRKLGHPVTRYILCDSLLPYILTCIRDRMFTQYRALFPDEVDRRLRDVQRRRGEYVVAGPNLVWSVDGHDKLQDFGIGVYGGIDAHARYCVWNMVCVSNRTAVCILRGYLDCIKALGQQPRFDRSDRGGETVLMANAHLQLQQAFDPNMTFDKCWWYGTSTANQRIEAWWGQLTKSSTGKWIIYFKMLRSNNLFSKDVLADQVALLAIYFPTIRTEITHYVDKWNTHPIRKQPNRPNSMQGKPYRLYHSPGPGIQNYGLSIHAPTLDRLYHDVADYSKSATFLLVTETKIYQI